VARYREIYQDLHARITSGEFGVGQQLPAVATLQEHYEVPGLNTIRQAQQLLVDDGLLETRQGVGAFVISVVPRPRETDVLAELYDARAALARAIVALERGREHAQ
jgi:DNA-binding GntR family transcriptional regulator